MGSIGRILVTILQVFFVIVAIWQAIGLLPVLTWFNAPTEITGAMWVFLVIKVLILLLAFCLFKACQWVKRRLSRIEPALTR